QHRPEGLGVAVVVALPRVAQLARQPHQGVAGLLGDEQLLDLKTKLHRLGLDERPRLAETEKPAMAVEGFLQGQAVVAKMPAPALDRHPCVSPAIGQGHDQVPARYPRQFGEHMVKILEMLQHLDANHAGEAAVGKGQGFETVEIGGDIRIPRHVDAGVGHRRDELAQGCLETAHIQHGTLQAGFEAAGNVQRAVAALGKGHILDGKAHRCLRLLATTRPRWRGLGGRGYFFCHCPVTLTYWPGGVFSMAFLPARASTSFRAMLFRWAMRWYSALRWLLTLLTRALISGVTEPTGAR